MHSDAGAMLYVFADIEAVIKNDYQRKKSHNETCFTDPELLWIGCLTESIWTQKSKSVTLTPHTNKQTSGPKGINFTRDEWSHLLHLFNMSHFSSLRCTKHFNLICCNTMAKKNQEQKEGERVVSKSRPAMSVSSYLVATSSSAASSPIASKSPGMSGASVKPSRRMKFETSSFDAASASQVRLKDAYLGRLMGEQQRNLTNEREQISEESDDSESEPWYYKPDAHTDEACGKPLAGETAESISSTFQKSQNNKEATLEHFFAYRRELLQNPSLEIIQAYPVVLCFPHNNVVGTHLCDECTRSNAPIVCRKLLSIL